MTITVTWNTQPETTTTYTVLAGDVNGVVKGDVVVKFHGSKGGESAKDWEITRANTKSISYS
jgi:hypothetical protein